MFRRKDSQHLKFILYFTWKEIVVILDLLVFISKKIEAIYLFCRSRGNTLRIICSEWRIQFQMLFVLPLPSFKVHSPAQSYPPSLNSHKRLPPGNTVLKCILFLSNHFMYIRHMDFHSFTRLWTLYLIHLLCISQHLVAIQ